MIYLLFRIFVILSVVTAGSILLNGAEPVFWQVSTESELLTGEAEGLSIDSQGKLTLGPAVTTLFTSRSPFLWNLTVGEDGRIWTGTGNQGQVYELNLDGQATVLFDADEIEVHAIARGLDGMLYVGTSPGARLYRVSNDGTAELFFDLDGEYVWALEIDANGTVYAATGEPGNVYRVEPDGSADVFYRTGATHAITLAWDQKGGLLIGTAAPGRIFHLDATGRPFVLLDSPYNEIRRLRLGDDGSIYAAAVGRISSTDSANPSNGGSALVRSTADVPTISSFSTSTSSGQQPASSGLFPQTSNIVSGAVYRSIPNGGWDLIWQSTTDSPYDIIIDNGTVFIATGNNGKLFLLFGDPLEPMLLAESDAQQITALARGIDGALLFATANPGQIVRLSSNISDTGSYLSSVRDAGQIATWGNIAWQGVTAGGQIEISTRSGNTSNPNETWSDWSQPYSESIGTPIDSPRTRFIQWRATLSGGVGATPTLDSVTIAYLPMNTRPRVTSISLHPPGIVFQETFPVLPAIAGLQGQRPGQAIGRSNSRMPALGRQEYQQGLMTFIWESEDDDQDELRYTAQYRRETATEWTILRSDLRNQILAWDTTSVPNGRYNLRIVASDKLANSPTTRLTGHLDSETFEIDNTAPTIEIVSITRSIESTLVAFRVYDADSAVRGANYSIDGNRWQAIYPLDGISDSRVEAFDLELITDIPAEIVIQATDFLNNTSALTVAIQPD
jgi:hypothetical protein